MWAEPLNPGSESGCEWVIFIPGASGANRSWSRADPAVAPTERGDDPIICDGGGEADSAVSQPLSDGHISSFHQILTDVHHVVSFLPPESHSHQENHHHLGVTSWLRAVGGLCAASGESHEYLMRQTEGMKGDA